MTAPSPGNYGDGSSSSSGVQDRNATDDFDGDEAADLGQDNALLADDPLEDDRERTP